MPVHESRRGLDLPIEGAPEPGIAEGRPVTRVALLGDDYPGLRPTMHVRAGDAVRRGQLLFEDKKMPGVRFTAPGAGTVVDVFRGERRAFQSVVIELSQAERDGRPSADEVVSFTSYQGKSPEHLDESGVRALLIESGLWTSLRARPFGRVANPADKPHAVFVTAMDTNPLAVSVDEALAGRQEDFDRGLAAVSKLTEGRVYVCTAEDVSFRVPKSARHEIFRGPHPAGTVGYHIHRLDPVNRAKTVWHIGYQDVAAIGRLFDTGELDVGRVISIAGPAIDAPAQVRTRLGAATDELVAGSMSPGENRVISGSVLSGRVAAGEAESFLGRYHLQISVLREGREREFLGWLAPGARKFSVKSVFLSALSRARAFSFTTSTHGSPRSIVPIGSYEQVFPMDILPTFLLRSLVMGDLERAEQLGCLELEEEDVALCSFVCPGKIDYGVHLRKVLITIEKEG